MAATTESGTRERRDTRASAGPDEGRRPTLVFVTSVRSGPARRMASLVAWYQVTRKGRLDVRTVDADRSPRLVERLGLREVPSLALVVDRRVVGRIDGRATGRQIDALLAPHVPGPRKRAARA